MNCWSHRPMSSRTSHSIDKASIHSLMAWPVCFYDLIRDLNLKKNIWGRAHIWTPPMSIPWLRGHCSGYVGNLIYSEEQIRQTLRKLPLLCSLRWRPVVDSKDIDGYICVLFEEDMLFLKRLWGWWSKKSTLKELNFGALDVSEYAIMPQRVGTPAEVLATSLFFFWIN